MNQLTSWQQLWDRAQPMLANAEQSLAGTVSPTPHILRVGQLDAELLDVELSTLKSRFEPELSLFIQLTLYRLSVWANGASYGAKLQDLEYTIASTNGRSITSKDTSRSRGLDNRLALRTHPSAGARLSKAWPDAPSSDRRRKAWELMTRLETAHAAVALASFIAFLWDGRDTSIHLAVSGRPEERTGHLRQDSYPPRLHPRPYLR
ncbi:hypothetical protein EDB83DRAFT_2514964 [Lactarius deliciosus]|nr:hypothetical protein EDB83DRAFT_2514964 [Lactarius deliciosus]